MKNISLVKISEFYYPSSEKDYQSLLAAGVTVFRLDATLLSLLKKTCLKAFELTFILWGSILPKIQASFLKKIAASEFKSKLETEGSIVVKFDKLKEAEFDDLLKVYRANLSRYGMGTTLDFRTTPEVKETSTIKGVPASLMVRIKIVENEQIDPSQGYNVKSLVDVSEDRLISFSSVARLKLVSALNASKKPFVSLVFEDKLGEQWVESFRRVFDTTTMSRVEINEFASNMIQALLVTKMAVSAPSKPKSKNNN